MTIKSEKALVNATASQIFDFLSDAANFEKLIPKEQIKDFKSDENGCSFVATGGFTIPLLYAEKSKEVIKMKSDSRAPFAYTLSIHIIDLKDKCEGFIDFNGDVNMFMKMMVEKPLTALFNKMANELKAQFA